MAPWGLIEMNKYVMIDTEEFPDKNTIAEAIVRLEKDVKSLETLGSRHNHQIEAYLRTADFLRYLVGRLGKD